MERKKKMKKIFDEISYQWRISVFRQNLMGGEYIYIYIYIGMYVCMYVWMQYAFFNCVDSF